MQRIQLLTLILSLCLCAGPVAVAQTTLTQQQQFEEDFDYLWKNVLDEYAYFDRKKTDWNKVREIYRPRIKDVRSVGDFVTLLEDALEELYDFHTHLNTNTASSPRLVPSGADMWAEWKDGRAVVTEVRPRSSAAKAGARVGMQVVSINGTAIGEAVRKRLGESLRTSDPEANNWALRILLAGRRNEKRFIEVINGGARRLLSLDDQHPGEAMGDRPLLDYRRVGRGIGYIRINNSLGNTALIEQFDVALAGLRNTRGLILDLRDTPSGGNTTVARGIMGRFISRDRPYQKHSIPVEERLYGTRRSWIELVSPRGAFIYHAPVVVLVDHWTGSMGEGVAIGMNGMKRATVVGTEMARLVGATSSIKLPHTGIGVTFPTEKLFHVNGTPREDFVPPVYVDLLARERREQEDAIFQVGLRTLRAINHSSRRIE